ncbi:GNAT family N-acetyltransferase [Streptomyces chrestomyceticus]|uniref:GNAT family N-acetyltransferase n=1 Tax=Streptomyces chrestomyceticus TaxID=68185 RepID=UPI0033D4003F
MTGIPMPHVTDLLKAEIEVNWPTDARGRFQGPHHLVLAVSADGRHQVPAAAAHLPDALAADLLAAVTPGPTPAGPGSPPPALPRVQRLLETALGPVHITTGPSYLIHPDRIRHTPTAPVVRSDTTDPAAIESLRTANPGNWGTDEWHDLLDRKLGPWAMALDPAAPPPAAGHPAHVVSLCHTPCWTVHGAEAGAWTRPGHRGRGHAATTTAAWSRLQAPTGRHLFYSTSATNHSSRNVAARLGLRPLGHLWKVAPLPDAAP